MDELIKKLACGINFNDGETLEGYFAAVELHQLYSYLDFVEDNHKLISTAIWAMSCDETPLETTVVLLDLVTSFHLRADTLLYEGMKAVLKSDRGDRPLLEESFTGEAPLLKFSLLRSFLLITEGTPALKTFWSYFDHWCFEVLTENAHQLRVDVFDEFLSGVENYDPAETLVVARTKIKELLEEIENIEDAPGEIYAAVIFKLGAFQDLD